MDLPDAPGVYIFRDKPGKPLYVGKAGSLRDRVRSYFGAGLIDSRSSAIAGMVQESVKLTYEETGSVLEALILEANTIKKYQPRFNVNEKDNKSFNYLVITKEEYPRILVVRGRELFQKWDTKEIKHLFGPFPQGASLKEAMKIVRKIFPFRDRCEPNPNPGQTGKPCFNAQIGLCPGICAGVISKTEYARAVRNIVLLFSGNIKALHKKLEQDMKTQVKAERFEGAAYVKRQLSALAHIRDVSLLQDEHRVAMGGGFRIEAYDIAHTAGNETVGVMTVVENADVAKSEYRMFKVKSVTNDDTGSLREILTRRLFHSEWQMPRLIVVDGGRAQVRTAERVLEKAGVQIPVIGVVKDEFHRPERLIGDQTIIKLHEKSILLANSEAHRFGIAYHRKKLRTRLL